MGDSPAAAGARAALDALSRTLHLAGLEAEALLALSWYNAAAPTHALQPAGSSARSGAQVRALLLDAMAGSRSQVPAHPAPRHAFA